MNYILQMNGFWRWRRTNELTNKQADIYYAILDCANSTGWKKSFNIPNSTLIGMCDLSKSELHKQRLVLIQKGLIEYSKGKKGSAGTYTISFLYETNAEINLETSLETNVEINLEDIPKQNKTKLKNKEKNIKKEKLERNVIPPSLESVTTYCHERNNSISPDQFVDFYSAKGWMLGKNKMVDWQSAIRTWEKNRSDKPKEKITYERLD